MAGPDKSKTPRQPTQKPAEAGDTHDFRSRYAGNALIAHGNRLFRWVVTLHRPSNVDGAEMMARIGGALKEIAAELPLIFPVHSRTRGKLEEFGVDPGPNITRVGPHLWDGKAGERIVELPAGEIARN